MAQYPRRGDERGRRYISSPVRAQHRWPGGFYTGEPEAGGRIRRFGEAPHGWGGYEANYDLPSARARRIDEHGRDEVEATFRGTGPKGYRRSDARTREIICERLTDDPSIDARGIEVTVSDGEVRLAGTVDSRRTKHHVEDLVERCSGIQNITNLLRVERGAGG